MSHAILYTENGDLVVDFETADEARTALHELVAENPSVRDRVGLLEFDAEGQPVGELRLASQIA
jgi:hypothetical protein